MANIFTNFLDSAAGDLQQTNLKDYKHASRLFVQNFYRLAPKQGFLYFVRFRLNPEVANAEAWRSSRQDLELGMLVKKCDLPKVTFEGGTVNVYNKKQPVYTKLLYQPINMVLHDDNAGLVRSFWQLYYQYYSADSYSGGANPIPGAGTVNYINRYIKPTLRPNEQQIARSNPSAGNYSDTTDPARYGLDSDPITPLIRSIEIYQLSRKNFFMHTIINPKIRSWNMDTVASDAKNLMEHNVTLEYEGIYFGKGRVTRFNPDGWTDLHYDLDPSPIGGIFGRTDGSLFGPFGLIADGTTLFQDLQGIQDGDPVDQRTALAVLLKSARLISNASNLNTSLAEQEVRNATLNSAGFAVTDTATGSVVGLVMPNSTFNDNVTTASAKQTAQPISVGTTTTTTTTTTVSDPYTSPDVKTAINISSISNAPTTTSQTSIARLTNVIKNSPNLENLTFMYYLNQNGVTALSSADDLIRINRQYDTLTYSQKQNYQNQVVSELTSKLTESDGSFISNALMESILSLTAKPGQDLKTILSDNKIDQSDLATYQQLVKDTSALVTTAAQLDTVITSFTRGT